MRNAVSPREVAFDQPTNGSIKRSRRLQPGAEARADALLGLFTRGGRRHHQGGLGCLRLFEVRASQAVGRLAIHMPPIMAARTGRSIAGKGSSSTPIVALAMKARMAARFPFLLIAPRSRQAAM